ncbi:MAG TPA: hypothetical protein VGY56_21895 [Verrucomicrobiae bacterium]|nr:hypothetical protein [Verrucomicrobiae bacterium]
MTTHFHQSESTRAREAQPEPEGASKESTADVLRRILDAPLSTKSPPNSQIVTGHLQGIDDEGRVLFVAEQGDGLPVPVVIGMAISDGVLIPAARNHQRALVVRTDESPSHWVLIGLVRERVSSAARDAVPGELEVKVDGETLRLTADREIELRCGNASLVLRQSGRVILKGTHVVTSSRGPLKVKGATVEIN